jgi:hypothetical protein
MREVRTERTVGVTSQLAPHQRMHLLALRESEAWPDLLDVLEMVCIEKETDLINTDPADRVRVLENHKMAKAAWQLFTYMQKKVDEEIALYKISVTPQRPAPEPTDEEMLIENILDPTRPAPLDDTYGVI